MAKILITDDSLLSRKMLRKILDDADYQVIEAKDGYSALEIFTIEKPDIVMLDLTMPGINGFEVLKQLKSINPAAKVIIASADVQTMTKDFAFSHGADGYVNKPFITEEIVELVQKLL
jgi:two-component system chemotaxis response regulator CheY